MPCALPSSASCAGAADSRPHLQDRRTEFQQSQMRSPRPDFMKLIEEWLEDAALERQWEAFYRDVAPSPREVRPASAIAERLTRGGRRKGAA